MIDNIDIILPLLLFESDDDFYYLQVLQRKKENPHLGSNSRVIKNYYIKSKDELLNKYDEIKTLCDIFNARAMLRLNKRSFKTVSFKTLVNISNTMSNGEYSFINKSYDRACGLGHNDKNKKWILDVDEELTPELYNIIEGFTYGVQPNIGNHKIICKMPTKNGWHVITSPFNLSTFHEQFPNIEIHKDNPINLYIK